MKRMLRICAFVLAAMLVVSLAGCGSAAKKEASAAFNKERERVAKQLETLSDEVRKAESWLDRDGDGFDPKLRTALEKKVEEAKDALNTELPELPDSTEAITAATGELESLELAKLLAELRTIIEAYRMSNR